jgi:hypothetical protein
LYISSAASAPPPPPPPLHNIERRTWAVTCDFFAVNCIENIYKSDKLVAYNFSCSIFLHIYAVELTKIALTETEDFNSINIVIKFKLLEEENGKVQCLFCTMHGLSVEVHFTIYAESAYMVILNRGLCHLKNTDKQYFVAFVKSHWGV